MSETFVDGTTVTLDFKTVIMGAMAGVLRNVEDTKKGLKHAHGHKKERAWQSNIEGCLGEIAMAAWLGRYPTGLTTLGAEDVDPDIEVRTRSADWHELPVNESDDDHLRVVLVTGLNGKYVVRGWIRAEWAKREEYLKTLPGGSVPAYFVPQSALEPMSEFDRG